MIGPGHGAFAQQRGIKNFLLVDGAGNRLTDFKHSIGARAGFTGDVVGERANRVQLDVLVTNQQRVAIVGSFSWAKSIVPARRAARIEVSSGMIRTSMPSTYGPSPHQSGLAVSVVVCQASSWSA